MFNWTHINLFKLLCHIFLRVSFVAICNLIKIIFSSFSVFFFFFFFFLASFQGVFPIVLAIFSFTGYSKHVLVKLSVLLKVFLFSKFLFAFFCLFVFLLFFYVFKSSLLLFWIVLSITLLLFSAILSVELSLQVTNVFVGFTVVLISVSCFIINVFARFTSLRYSIFSLKQLM